MYVYKHFKLHHLYVHAAAAAKSLQSCPTLCDPIDGSLRGAGVRPSAHGKGGIEPQESPWKSLNIYSQNQSLPTLLLCALTYTSDFMGAVPYHLFWRRS